MAVYQRGDLVRCTAEFANDAGVLTDPTTVTFAMVLGVATIATYVYGVDSQLAKTLSASNQPIPGSFFVDWDTTTSGDGSYLYTFVGTGAVQRAKTGSFVVD